MRPRLPALVVLLALLVLGTAGVGATAGAQTLPGEPVAPGDVGPGTPTHAVGRRTIEVTSEPGRTLNADVWYPADPAAVAGIEKTVYAIPGASYTSTVAYDAPPVAPGGPFPVIVYSHGSGGQRFISTYLTEALAARGYVVVAADHTGNTAVDQFTNTTLPRSEIVRLRPVDIRAEIAAMTAASADPASPFAGAVDADRVGLVGHSAGGAGVLQTAAGAGGAPVPAGLKGVVGMGAYVDPVTDAELKAIDAPTMLISGTLDDVTPIRTQTERAWKRLGAEPAYRVDLKGGGHQSYSDVCYYSQLVDARPSLPAPIVNAIKTRTTDACTPEFLPIETAHALIDQYAIGFFDRYVKGAKVAKTQLQSADPKVVTVRVKD